MYTEVYVESRGPFLASPTNTFFIVEMLIIEWSITNCDVTPESRIASFILLLVQRLCK